MPHLIAAFSTDLDAVRTTTLENDYIVSNFISQEFQEFDRMGWSNKWFDYRHMTLLQATHRYMEVYGDIYRRIYAREFDRERAEHIKPLNFELILAALRPEGQAEAKKVTKAKKQLVGCWRGRQIADMLGCPYDVYIDLAFTYRMRRWKQNTMPQPFHLYHEYDVEKIAERWEELQASKLYRAEHAAYMVQNYQNLPQQNDYHEWLFKQAKLRSNPAEWIATFIDENALPVEKVQTRTDIPEWEMIERYLQ
ncbi:hypothetical protein B9J07_28260 [Sinorhizobium sp. LM21]|uniref:hypothetical protein n=1 Tax=Sinorhizobium sp. LM21 TaxID=1449788 RepID=UPI0005D9C8A9|nr:hypothetical protein [Sinorhizobium sp. LM21]AJW30266.1 hypothetical protein pLM21S1_p148 [Sinorhizobium sp. LM21]OWZ90482.1 hypothetical protein B9J07_28260 [Sinorhizobium sp. LM21]